MGKVTEKIRSTVSKAKKYLDSDEGKRVKKAGVNFLRESGLGQKAVGKVSEHLKKHTKHDTGLDNARQLAHMYAHDYFQEKKPLPNPNATASKPPVHAKGRQIRTAHSVLKRKR